MAAYLVLSDIHSNLDALEAVLTAADGQWDRLLVLGDLVGYGGEPNGVIDRIRSLNPVAVIRGNHDKAACGIDDASNFNQIAKYAAMWTGETLTEDNRAAMNRDGVTVWLDVPFEEVLGRLPLDGRRPLAADRSQMERLFAARQLAYAQAHLRVDATGARADAVAERIMDGITQMERRPL